MPRGYERIDASGADHKDEHGIPLYPIRPDDSGVVVNEPSVTVHVGGAAATAALGGTASPSASAPLYYGESAGLYTPIAHNEIIERHVDQPGMPAAPTVSVSVGPAPRAAPLTAAAPASTNLYPAQAYVQTYPQLPAAVPITAMPVPQQHHQHQQQMVAVALPPGVPPQMMAPAAPMMYAPAPVMPQQQLVSVVPPVPQTLPQLRAMLQNRYVAFDTGRYLREGWAFTRANFCFFLCAILGLGALMVAAWLALYAIFVAAKFEKPYYRTHHYDSDSGSGSSDEGVEWTGGGIFWVSWIREALFELLVSTPITAGAIACIFEAIRDNAYMKWRTLFSAYSCPYWARLAGLSLLLSVLTSVLSMLFVIPGIWFAVVSAFAIPFHLQFKHIPLRASHAIGLSIKTLHRNCCSFFGFVLACALLNVLGFVLLGVGLLVTIPITAAASAYCYHHLVGINGAAVLVPIETAMAYQQQAAAMAAAVAAPAPVMAAAVALPVAVPVQAQQTQPQVVVVVSPQHQQH